MSNQPLWLTYLIEILLVLEFQLTKNYFGMFSYKAHFRPQISPNENYHVIQCKSNMQGHLDVPSPVDLKHLRT